MRGWQGPAEAALGWAMPVAGAVVGQSQGLSWTPWFCRDTMLQALRFVIQGAGAKVDAVIRKNIISLLLSMLGHDEVGTTGCRTMAGLVGSFLWLASLLALEDLVQLPTGQFS